MISNFKRIVALAILGASMSLTTPVFSQDVIEIQPLFEYPIAPQEMSSLTDKSNYLVDHFWDAMDFKSKTAVDQNALNHAFKVYCTPMRFAEKERTLASVDKLLEKISKNPALLMQFTKAAEENLYGPRAEIWIDEVYLRFLKALTGNKKVPESRRKKYVDQAVLLENTANGVKAPEFKFTDRDGKSQTYFPMSTPTIIIFGDPSLSEWRMSRLKMETNVALTQAVNQGKLNIMFIVPSDSPGWRTATNDYPKNWIVGASSDVAKIYDLRVAPSVYLIGADTKLMMKNVSPQQAVNEALYTISTK